jgi:hypothetical protein
MKQRCLLLLSLFLATLTGAWAQGVVSDVREVDAQVPCAAPAATRTITINYDITVATIGPNCIMAITNADGSIVYGSTVLTGAQLTTGNNKTVDVDVPGLLASPSIGQGRVARFRRDPGGTTNYVDYTDNMSSPVSPSFDILITPSVSGATPADVCEGSTMDVIIAGTNLDLYGDYTVSYTLFAGIVPVTSTTAPATTVSGSALTFTTVPITLAITGIVITGLTAANSPNCGPSGLPTVDAIVNVRQLPTISGAVPRATPVCVGDPAPIILQGLQLSGGPGGLGPQTITYTVNGAGAPITSAPFVVTSANQEILLPGINPNDVINIIAISRTTPITCPRNLSPSVDVEPYFNVVTGGAIDVNGTGAVAQTMCEGDTPLLLANVTAGTGTPTVGASVAVISYRWEYSGPGTCATAGVWIPIPGTNSPNYQPVANTQDYALRRVTISTLDGVPCEAVSNCIDDIVNNITAGTIAADQTICEDATASLTGTVPLVPVADGDVTYLWQSSITGCADWADAAGTNTDQNYTTAALTQDTWFQRRDRSTLNGVPCDKFTNCIKVWVNNLTPGVVAADQTICSGGNPAAFTTPTAATADGTLSYQWEKATSDALTCPASVDFSNATGGGGVTLANYNIPAGLTQDTWYRRKTTSTFDPDGAGPLPSVACFKYTNCIKITVNNVDAGAIAADQVICSGDDPADLTSTTAGTGDGDITYVWEQSTTGCGPAGPWTRLVVTTEGFAAFPVANDIFYRRVTISTLDVDGPGGNPAVACEAISNCVSIFVNNVTAGTIQGNELLCAFADPTPITDVNDPLTSATGDGPLTYRWESTTVAGCASGWTTIPGAAGISYDPPAGIVFTTCYRRVAISTWNAAPDPTKTCEAISNVITKTVESGVPAPTGGPTFTPATACQTLPAGSPLAVTNNMNCPMGTAAVWYTADYPAAPPANWANGGNAPTTLPTTAVGIQTFYVACKQITPPYCESITRTPITFEVLPAPNNGDPGQAPPAITFTPSSICEGATPVALTSDAAAVCGTGFTPVWYAASTGATISNPPAMTPNSPAGNYDFWVACKNDVTGCESLNRRRVRFVVNPAPPAPFLIPLAADPTPTFYPSQACQGPLGSTVALNPVDIIAVPNTVPFNITCGIGRTMKWYMNDGITLFNGGVSPTSLPTDVPGVHTYQVSCIQNSTGCESLTKTAISFTVNPAPDAPTAPIMLSPMTACFDTPSGAVMTNTATCQGVGGPANPIWYTFDGVTETALPGAPAVTPAVTTVYHVYCKNVNTNCVSLTFTAVTFTKFPLPTITAIAPDNATYCNAAPVFPLPLSGTPATAIAPNSAVWFKYSGGASIGLADGTTSTGLPGFNAINNGTVVVNVPITITPYTWGPNGMNDGGTGDDCLGAPFTYTITVIPTPTVTFTCPAPVCANDAFSAIAFSSPVAGTVFNWTNDNTTIGLGAAGMGDIASFTGLNASTTLSNIGVLSVTPSVTVNSVTCVGPVVTCNLRVKPRPSSNLTASQTDVCPNTEVTLNPNCSIPTPTSTVQWGNGAGSALPAPAGPTVTPTAPDLTYIYTAICSAEGCAGNMSEATVRTHRLLVDIVKVAHPGGDVNQPGAILEVQNDLGKDLSVPKNTIVSNDGMTPRTWNIVARPCYAPVGSISFEFLGGPLPLSYKTVDNFAPHAFFANDGASTFYSQASMTYGPGSMLPFYTGGTPNFPNGIYTVLVQGRTNAVPGAIPAARNKLSGGALLSTRTVTFEVKGTNTGGARIGVEEEVVDAENWLSLVQNPISEEIMVRISGKVGDNVQLNLSNLQGQEVHTSSLQLETTSQLNKINARDFSTGFYILKAVNGDKVKTIKVLKVQ